MTQKDPLLHNSLIICILHFERGDSQQENIPTTKPSKPPAELLRSLRQNKFEKMIHFTVDSINISAPFLRAAEHTFGIRCLTS